ncbi:restriction endonuclease subunit S [Clostridium perfringens]|uniref:restriction endonuclease subunit S n=1 Tax=Clostridium perfringens TaxID=1502 RepID=UPI001F20A9E1|nr:restriction endonuclease subunit S [Clostridium perfringens]ELC8421319.1 restriction endonuclease subunit S [Clostridium perfringens]MCF2685328.1 restriction endonuclease subunit S [Clostridium perfringens]
MSRNVPKLRFKGFEDEWIKYKADDLFINISDKKHNGELNVLSVTQDKGVLLREELEIDIKFDIESVKNYKRVKAGDFIISLRSFQGGFEISNQEGLISPAYTVFNFKDSEKFNSKYFSYIFKSSRFIKKLAGLIYGVRDGKAISFTDFKTMTFFCPSLQEQEKIANFLSKVDSIIEKQEKKVQYWNSYKKGMMQKIFSQKIRFKDENGMDYPEWKINKIENIATIEMGFTPSTKNDEAWNGNIEWLSIAGMNSKYIYSGNKKISSEILGKRKLVPIDTLIMSFKLTIGRLAIVKKEIVTNEAICQFYWKSKDISNEYMYAYLSVINIESFGCRAAKGITLNTESLNSIVVKLPCLEEQTKIANFLSNIDNIIEKESKKLEELKQWKKGLLQQMFV